MRSILAVIGGFITLSFIVAVLTVLSGSMIHGSANALSPTYLGLTVLYRLFAAVAAGVMTALIAGRKPLEHAGALAAISLIAGALSYRSVAGRFSSWYVWTMLLVPPLLMVAGGFIVARKEASLKSQ